MSPPKKMYTQQETAALIEDHVRRDFKTVVEAAHHYGVSRKFVYDVMDAKPGKYATEEMLKAIGFEKEPTLFFRKVGEDNDIKE